MALTIEFTADHPIDLPEFLSEVDRKHDVITVGALQECAPLLARLAKNREFLVNFILEELKNLATFQRANNYTAQTLMLGGIPGKFYVRANVWLPRKLLHPVNFLGEQRLYSYDFPHDHNFDFLTVGYYGAGYSTDIYEYDSKFVKGEVGEPVEIRYLESTNLPENKLMIYRAGEDIHVQRLPSEFSISLNLLAPARAPHRDQYTFDLGTSSINGILRSPYLGQKWLIDAAASLCDTNVSNVLATIAATHSLPRTRLAARAALNTCESKAHQHHRKISDDP